MRNLAIFAVCAIALALIVYFARDRIAAHDAATGDTIERIQDATDNPDGCAWADRLRGACD